MSDDESLYPGQNTTGLVPLTDFDGVPIWDTPPDAAEIAAQWAQSAHRFASLNNPYYTASLEQLRRERGAAAARFCAGCHDPLLLVDDAIVQPRLPRQAPAATVPDLAVAERIVIAEGRQSGVVGGTAVTRAGRFQPLRV